MNTSSKPERLVFLDGIKVFALLMVFALHTQRAALVTEPCHNAVFFYAARCCMPLFFMVNGSLILRRDTFEFSYYRRKLFGILRVLVFSGCFIGLYVFFFHHFPLRKALKEAAKGLLSYTPYAFLWFLYSFALVYTLLLVLFPWVKAHLQAVLCALAALCITLHLLSLFSIAHGGFFIQAAVTQRLRLWTWCFYFCLGRWLCTHCLHRFSARFLCISAAVLTAAVILWQYWLCFMQTGQIESSYLYDDPLIMLWSAALFLCFAALPRLSAWFAKFAPCSFGAFLIHGFLLDAFQLQSTVHGPVQSTLAWAGLVAASWLLSWGLNKVPYVREALRY